MNGSLAFVGTFFLAFDLAAPVLPLVVSLPAGSDYVCAYVAFRSMCLKREEKWATSAPQFSQIRWSVHDVSSLQVDRD